MTSPGGFSPQGSNEQQFLAWLEEKLRSQPKPSFVLPVLGGNPPTSDPTNMWVLFDGRLRVRWWDGSAWQYREYAPITPTAPAPPAPPAKPPAAKTRTKTWTAEWTQTYQGDGDKRTDDRGNKYLVYGSSGDSFNGRNRSLIGFDYADIDSTLTGSTVKRVQLRLTNVHAYWNSGVDIWFGIHNVTSEPASWPSGSIVRSKISKQHFGKPQTKTVDLPLEFATRIRAGTGKGIAIEAPDGDVAHYGYAGGVGSGYTPPQMTVTYVK